MKFTIIHPSRGRPKMAHETFSKWMNSTSSFVQYILSLDNDDAELQLYQSAFKGVKIVTGDNSNLVEAINRCIPLIENECVIIVSDDFDPAPDWDNVIQSAVGSMKYYGVHVNDGYSFPKELMTLPVLSKSLIDELGYIYYPGYTGMFADNDLYGVVSAMGCIVTADPTKVFQHNHFVNNRSKIDQTYKRHNNPVSWGRGERLYSDRKKNNFDLIAANGNGFFSFTPSTLLSILICSIDDRIDQLEKLIHRFHSIGGGEMVEILFLSDDRKMKIGDKRNRLLKMASGEWVVFFDDDDWPYDHYISEIYSAIRTQPGIDCIGINGVMTTNGTRQQKWVHRLGLPILSGMQARRYGFDYTRPIWHFNPVRRSIALAAGFDDTMSFGEDEDYAKRLNPMLTREYYIKPPLFHYKYQFKTKKDYERNSGSDTGI